MNPRRFALYWGLSLLAGLALMTALAPYDLAFSRAVAHPGSSFGWVVTWFGELPGVGLGLTGLLLLLAAWRWPSWRRHRALGASLTALTLLHPVGLTQLLKVLWGRRRFGNLRSDFADYTPFFQPLGFQQGRSFPSGHVAIASVSLLLPLYLHARGRHRAALASWLPCAGYPLAVAAGRIYEGRHYLTDAVFSLLLSLWLSPLLARWALRRWPADPSQRPSGLAPATSSRDE